MEPHHWLSDLAMDSFQALTMKHRLETDLGILVPMAGFLEDQTLGELADRLVPLLEHSEATEETDPSSDVEWEEGRL
jgi:hypothetical protein